MHLNENLIMFLQGNMVLLEKFFLLSYKEKFITLAYVLKIPRLTDIF